MRSILLLGVFAAACSSAAEPDRVRVMGSIAGYVEGDPHVEVVAATGVVTVRVTTYGNGCYSQGPTEVIVNGREALVTPWDYTLTGTACIDILRVLTHVITVPFGAPGPARIMVRGLDLSRASATAPRGDTILVAYPVTVP